MTNETEAGADRLAQRRRFLAGMAAVAGATAAAPLAVFDVAAASDADAEIVALARYGERIAAQYDAALCQLATLEDAAIAAYPPRPWRAELETDPRRRTMLDQWAAEKRAVNEAHGVPAAANELEKREDEYLEMLEAIAAQRSTTLAGLIAKAKLAALVDGPELSLSIVEDLLTMAGIAAQDARVDRRLWAQR